MTRGKATACAISFAATLYMLGACYRAEMFNHTTVRDIDTRLRTELPPNAGAGAVIAALDRMHVEHGPLRVANEADSIKSAGSTRDTRPGAVNPDYVIRAVWRETSVGLVTETAIEARFLFGPDRRLTRVDLDEVIIGM